VSPAVIRLQSCAHPQGTVIPRYSLHNQWCDLRTRLSSASLGNALANEASSLDTLLERRDTFAHPGGRVQNGARLLRGACEPEDLSGLLSPHGTPAVELGMVRYPRTSDVRRAGTVSCVDTLLDWSEMIDFNIG
jgi:hypothetical protein